MLIYNTTVYAQAIDSSSIQYNKDSIPSGLRLTKPSTTSINNATTFLKNVLANGNTDITFSIKSNVTDELSIQHLRYDEIYKGVKVFLGEYLVHGKNSLIETANGNYVPVNLASVTPALTESQALTYALSGVNATSYKWQNTNWENFIKQQKGSSATFYPQGELCIIPRNLFTNNTDVLAYIFDIATDSPNDELSVVVDANTGSLINKRSLVCNTGPVSRPAETVHSGLQSINCDQISSTEFDLQETYTTNNPGTNIITKNFNQGSNYVYTNNTSPYEWTSSSWPTYSTDKAAIDIHWGMEKVLDYWKNKRLMNSYDNNNAPITNIVNVMTQSSSTSPWKHLSNAGCYAKYGYIEFGDGDNGVTWDAFSSLDIVAHEFGHFVSYKAVNFYNANPETSALDEGLSDIWAACVKAYVNDPMNNITLPQPKEVWVMGDEIINHNVALYARSMQDPPSGWDFGKGFVTPDCYKGNRWYTMFNPSNYGNADGHFSNGVINKWFYLLSEGGNNNNKPNEVGNKYNVIKLGIQEASAIIFQAEKHYLFSSSFYYDARWATIQAAIDLYGYGSFEEQQVTNAWYAVNVGELYKAGYNCVSGVYSPLKVITGSQSITGNVYIPKDLTITNNNKVSITNCNAIFESGVKITVQSGATLNIYDSHFSTCQGLWKGIILEPGAYISIDGSNNISSLIEDAEVAISCDYANTSPIYTDNFIAVNNTIFNKNNVGIKIENYTADAYGYKIYPFSISNCIFTSRRIFNYNGTWDNVAKVMYETNFAYPQYPITPNSYSDGYIGEFYHSYAPDTYVKNPITGYSNNKPLAGILLSYVGNVSSSNADQGIKIGKDGSSNVNSYTTIFDNLGTGIQAENCNLTVNNCTFQNGNLGINIFNPPALFSGNYTTGSTPMPISNYYSQSVVINTPVTVNGCRNNAFFDMKTAINISGSKKILIEHCDIVSKQSFDDMNDATKENGKRGIKIQNYNFDDININHNIITNIRFPIDFYSSRDRVFSPDPINIGALNISHNQIKPTLSGGVIGSTKEYVENAINLSTIYVSGSDIKPLKCSENEVIDVINGIRVSNWQNQNIVIESNSINLKEHPTIPDYVAYGINLEGGSPNYNTNSLGTNIVDNTVTGTGSAGFASGILLNQQTGAKVECNKVHSNNHGFRFVGACPETRWWDNIMNNNNRFGVTLDGAVIGDQGINNVGIQVCTPNNSFTTDLSGWPNGNYMTNCIHGTDAKQSNLMILYNPTSTDPNLPKLNPDGSGNSDIYIQYPQIGTDFKYRSQTPINPTSFGLGALVLIDPSTTTIGNCPRCANPVATRTANNGMLVDIANGVINVPDDAAEDRLYVMQQQLYELLASNPDLSQNDFDLQQFIYNNHLTNLELIHLTGKYLVEGNTQMVNFLLNYWNGRDNSIGNNYFQYYRWIIDMYNNPNYTPDLQEVYTMANKCPLRDGIIIYAFRNLYNSLTDRINSFEETCNGTLARGVQKTNTYKRVKEKSNVTINKITGLFVYPNPANRVLNISLNDIKAIELYDVLGKKILSKTFSTLINSSIDISKVANGVYIVKATQSNGASQISKIIINH